MNRGIREGECGVCVYHYNSDQNVVEEKVFIPETLINFETSAEYIECTNYNFEIYPIIRRFTSSDEKNIYEKEIVDKLRDRLHGLVDFANLNSQVNIGSDTIYLEKEDIEMLEDMILLAINEANKKVDEMTESKVGKFGNSMPGLF